ncbi:hypothetical protein PR202_ga11123 [Eleusine coracana subsp. coracana]|uniref:F-box domain-containing protein n=1 Tax=Eleusine coracana subsp. coracana TaxID=191504 RepID=A0AAV5C8J1_ELECO|nr:hypothetical protein PR202_ga11123 [Eleusine coracana subsp. coracana]
MAPSEELTDDLIGEFLLRLSPEDPACLLCASLVCKRWRRILADPAFRRRHRALHRTPPVVGFIRIVSRRIPYCSRFVPINPAFRPAARDLPGCWLVVDCRRGRALFVTPATGPGAEGNPRSAPVSTRRCSAPPPRKAATAAAIPSA